VNICSSTYCILSRHGRGNATGVKMSVVRHVSTLQETNQHDCHGEKIGMHCSNTQAGSSLCARWRGWLRASRSVNNAIHAFVPVPLCCCWLLAV